jgi:Adenylosuccinate synthase
MPRIPVCVAYDYKGERLERFPYPEVLNSCRPIIEYFDGWNTDISNCRKYSDLPLNAQKYIEYLRIALNAPIKYISLGPGREQYIEL